MTWNYRVMRHEDGSLFLHEVYYDKDGKPTGWTLEPITFAVDAEEGVEGIVRSLEMALRDAKERPILDVMREASVREAMALSEPAFAAVWDNPDDAAYDDL